MVDASVAHAHVLASAPPLTGAGFFFKCANGFAPHRLLFDGGESEPAIRGRHRPLSSAR